LRLVNDNTHTHASFEHKMCCFAPNAAYEIKKYETFPIFFFFQCVYGIYVNSENYKIKQNILQIKALSSKE